MLNNANHARAGTHTNRFYYWNSQVHGTIEFPTQRRLLHRSRLGLPCLAMLAHPAISHAIRRQMDLRIPLKERALRAIIQRSSRSIQEISIPPRRRPTQSFLLAWWNHRCKHPIHSKRRSRRRSWSPSRDRTESITPRRWLWKRRSLEP